MNHFDFIVLFGTLITIVGYGVWKTRLNKNIEGYLRGDGSMKWGTIGLSVMATQASAITFISTPGQGYESGMGFVQNYLGLPIALVVVSAIFIPVFYKLKVYTAYEYLENRFDLKTRILGAGLFLVQRGLAAGITIYAPAIIISSILDWDLTFTILLVGVLVIIYTVSGGTKAVSLTQKHQMAVILAGMLATFFIIVSYLSDYVSFVEALNLAGALGKLNAIDPELSFEKRYTLWSGLTGGFFLALSYFGTDQSQVARYIGGKNVWESRMGLMFNAVMKIPMQFFILLTGVLVYVFFVFYEPPLHFKQQNVQQIAQSERNVDYQQLKKRHQQLWQKRRQAAIDFSNSGENKEVSKERFDRLDQNIRETREQFKQLALKEDGALETKDSDYIFLTFIIQYLPHGLIGLLMAVIFSAAMSSTSSELNSLASTTVVDLYQRNIQKEASEVHYLKASKLLTLIWGLCAIAFALMAKNSENLIEAVNIVGSIFYGTILGIFLVAFLVKKVQGTAVFYGAVAAEMVVISCHVMTELGYFKLGYLWYNAIGCGLTIVFSRILQEWNGK